MRIIFLFIFLSFVSFGIWRGITHTDVAQLTEIKIIGASSETEARIRSHLLSKIGDPFWRIPVEKEAALIKADSWIDTVDVRRQLLSTLLITITERKPFAILNNGKGHFQYVDVNNNVIAQAPSEEVGSYPLLSESDFETKKDLRAQAIELLKTLPRDGFLSREDMSELEFNQDRGFQFTLSKTGMVVEIGKDNLPLHIDRARKVGQYLEQHRIDATRIDSDYSKKVLVKVRKRR